MKLSQIFAKNMRQAREEKKITFEKLGEKTGISFQYLNRIEKKSINVGIDTIGTIADGLGVDYFELLTKKD